MRSLIRVLLALTAYCAAALLHAQAPKPVAGYPAAARGDVVETYHGARVADPYRWLEDLDGKETAAWVAEQNKLTFGFLETLPQRQYFKQRLTELWNYPRFGVPFKEGGRYFFTRNSGLQNQAVLYVQEKLESEPRVLLDPNTLAKDGTVALTLANASPNGKLLVYGTAAAGSDWNEYRVRSIDTGEDRADVVKWVKFSSAAWTHDNAGFFYSRYPTPAVEDGTGKTFGKLEKQTLYYHKLGTPQNEDRLVYEMPEQPQWFVWPSDVTDDGRYAVIEVSRGSAGENTLYYIDLVTALTPKIDAPVKPLIAEWLGEHAVVGNDGSTFYVVTNHEAPRKRLVAIDLAQPEPKNWKTLIPQTEDPIESVTVIGGRFVVKTMHHASSRLAVFAKDGKALGPIALPGIGAVASVSGRHDEPEFFYNFVSFATPTTIYRHDVASNQGAVFQSPKVAFEPGEYETKQVFYTSKDGTRVPMFITHRKGLKLDGSAPTILYGYGGFDVSLNPFFSVTNLAWMEAGGVYALPNIRGGGEYGQEWHKAGTKERKQNVFDDFIAAGEWLIANKYTSSAKLVLSGGSNGGLLVAAVINQRPDLARVAWPAVGVMDMLRFHKHTVGFAWASDYGSSDDIEGFKYLSAYSPIHNIKAGVKYPAVLVTTADHDDRVHPGHSFKYAAAMQAAVSTDLTQRPVMIRVETKAGHGSGKPTSKVIDEAADKLAFASHFIGLNPKAGEPRPAGAASGRTIAPPNTP